MKIESMVTITGAEYEALCAEVEQLRAALPDGMEHCKIVFEECPVGHGHLRGDNWLKKDCQRCRVLELEAENTELREELDTWKSVFPDIAPASVLPDRSLLEADNARLRAALERLSNELRQFGYEESTLATLTQEPRT